MHQSQKLCLKEKSNNLQIFVTAIFKKNHLQYLKFKFSHLDYAFKSKI